MHVSERTQTRSGLSLQKRRDDTYGYVYTTSSGVEGDRLAADVAHDTNKPGTVYALVYDEQGYDSVVEITSIADADNTAPGWSDTGPSRPGKTDQPFPMYPDDESWCGSGLNSNFASCANQSHPGGQSMHGWNSVEQTAHGWVGPGGYRSLALDTSGSYTHVYAALNMWRPVESDYEFHFRIFRWDGAATTLAADNDRDVSSSYAPSGNGNWTLDAITVNQNEGTLLYKMTPKDAGTKSVVGILKYDEQSGTLASVKSFEISADLMLETCESCLNFNDAFRFTAAAFSADHDTAIFVGSSRIRIEEGGEFTYFPSIFKLDAMESSFNGAGEEIYFNGANNSDAARWPVTVPVECEGVLDSRQGRFSTFSSLVINGDFGYAGTAAAGCVAADCARRAGCIWMFNLDFEDEEQLDAPLVLSGGSPGGLGEIDVHSMTIESDGTRNGGFLYALTGAPQTLRSRIVKIEIGGSDVADSCTSGCFRRIASFLASEPTRAMTFIPDLNAILTASSDPTTTTYKRYSSSEVLSLSPKYGPASGSSTLITITGTGFPVNSTAACRFGHSNVSGSDYPIDGWVSANVVSSTEIHCYAPSSVQVSTTSGSGAVITGNAEVQLSFDGNPGNGSGSSSEVYENSLWTDDHVFYRYYTPPHAAVVLVNGNFPPVVMYTGETSDRVPGIIVLRGGPFIYTGAGQLLCRFNENATSDQNATFISSTEIHCPICKIMETGDGDNRCGQLSDANTFETDMKMHWLPDEDPREVEVSFTLNGLDFHTAGTSLTILGSPQKLTVAHTRTMVNSHYTSDMDDFDDGNMTLDDFDIQLIDMHGRAVENDYGKGGTTGLTVSCEITDVASSQVTSLQLSSAVGNTTYGSLIIAPRFDNPLKSGDYDFGFNLRDCTVNPCEEVIATTLLTLSVLPGTATQIFASSGTVSEAASEIPDDFVARSASASVDIGVMFVMVLDAAGNQVHGHDGLRHSIGVRSTKNVTESGDDERLENRTAGALLTGTTVILSTDGVAIFKDLHLISQSDSPTRGENGEESIYWLQFDAGLPGLAADTRAYSTLLLKISPGVPAYLNTSGLETINITCNSPLQLVPNDMVVYLYDGGNNMIKDHASRTVEVKSATQSDLVLSGAVEVSASENDEALSFWYFPENSISVQCKETGSYYMEFSAVEVQPASQIIEMLHGDEGYSWRCDELEPQGNIVSAVSVQVAPFRLNLVDGGGNTMGVRDGINRKVSCSSSTALLSNISSFETAAMGYADVTGLLMLKPSVGEHVIKCGEFGNVDGNITEGGELTLYVSSGTRETLVVQTAQHAGDTTYASSLGAVDVDTFSIYASSDYIVPLDIFSIRVADGGGNYLFGALPAYNNTETNMLQDVRIVSAALHGESISGLYPYITRVNRRLARSEVLIRNPMHTRQTDDDGISVALSDADNQASFESLALYRPTLGTFTLAFNVAQDALLSAAVSVHLTIVAGRAHHVGIAAPCAETETCDEATTLHDDVGYPCTCAVYAASEIVALSPLRAYVLDGGENRLLTSYSPTCEPNTGACSAQRITIQHSPHRTGLCQLEETALDGASLGCDANQPTELSCAIADDECHFSNLALLSPKQADAEDPLLLTFSSPGLISASFGLKILPGVAVKLGILSQGLQSTARSSFATPIDPLLIQVVDIGGSPLNGSDTQQREITMSCNTADIVSSVLLQTDDETNSVLFDSIVLSSPGRGTHELLFSSVGLEAVSWSVVVTPGEPVRLQTFEYTTVAYTATTLLTVMPITVRLYDAGNNYVGSTNDRARTLFANVTAGPTVYESPGYTQVTDGGENLELVRKGFGMASFESIQVQFPLVGSYNITFGGDGLTGTVASFSVQAGAPHKLAVPASHVMLDGRQYDLQTSYSSDRELLIGPFAVLVMDGGGNPVGQLDVDSSGAGLRREIEVVVSGSLIQTSTSELDDQKVLLTPGGAVAVDVASASTTTFAVSISSSTFGEALVDDLELISPRLGAYNITVNSADLVSFTFEVFVTQGIPSSLDACACLECRRRITDGVCVDTKAYISDVRVSIRELLVVMRDAGGSLIGTSSADGNENRNVTVELIYGRHLVTGVETRYTSNETIISNSTMLTLETRNGAVAWCSDGQSISPAPQFCRPADDASIESYDTVTDAYNAENVGTSTGPITGKGEDYYGISPQPHWTGKALSIDLDLPFAGVFGFKLSSSCATQDDCLSLSASGQTRESYRELLFDVLEITITPGTPHTIDFSQAPPDRYDNDVVISPAIQLIARDVAGNTCNDLNTIASVTVSPQERRLHGQTTSVIDGIATFSNFRLHGDRGTEYSLQFSLIAWNLSVIHSSFLVLPCNTVKPNSRNNSLGQCECVPGYTEDIRTQETGGTGFTEGLTTVSAFPTLYDRIILEREKYIRALNPYGLCVPCANGFYKPIPGPQRCSKCPLQMDTTWKEGAPRGTWTTLSGEARPGFLGNYDLDSCHCVVQQNVTGHLTSVETYRAFPHDDFRCERCPQGGSCNGLTKAHIRINEGRWRASLNATQIYTCPNDRACLGGTESACSIEYEGILCAICKDGYAKNTLGGSSSPTCSRCTEKTLGGFVLVIQLVVQACLLTAIFRFAIRKQNGSIGLCRTLLSHFNMLALFNDVDLGWSKAQYMLFKIAETISTPSMRNFEVDCLLQWNHYQYTGFYTSLPGVIMLLSVFCYLLLFAKGVLRRKREFLEEKIALQEQIAAERRKGKDITELQEALEIMSVKPDFFLSLSARGALRRTGGKWEGEDGNIVHGPSDEEFAQFPATSYDVTFCFSLVFIYWSWITIIKHLAQLIRFRRISGAGSFLYVDLSISADTTLYQGWLVVLVTFLFAYVFVIPYYVFQCLRRENDRLHWLSTKTRLGFLFQGLKPEYYWWEFVVMGRKLALMVISVILPERPLTAAYCALFVMQAAVGIHLICDPFQSSRQQSLELFSLVVIIFTYHIGILVRTSKHALQSTGFHVFFSMLQVTLNAAVVLCFSVFIFKDMILESITSKVTVERSKVEAEDDTRKEVVHEELLSARPQFRSLHPRLAGELKSAIDGGRVRNTIAQAEVPDLWMKHVQLNVNLEMLRNNWRDVKKTSDVPRKNRSPKDVASRNKQNAAERDSKQNRARYLEHRRETNVVGRVESRVSTPARRESKSGNDTIVSNSFQGEQVKVSSELRTDPSDVKRIREEKLDGRHANVLKGDKKSTAPKSWRDRMEDSEWRMQQRMQYRRKPSDDQTNQARK